MNRRQLLRRASGAVGALWWSLPTTAAQSDDLTDLPAAVEEWMREFGVVGAGVALVRPDRPVWSLASGMRNREAGMPVDDTTVFQAASLSKPVFACAVLSLAAEGKVDLDRPLVDYLAAPFLPRLPRLMASRVPDDPRLKLITARIVLSHSTGFPNWGRDRPLTIRADPGSRFGYSGEGYIYLQNVVEHLTGLQLDALVRARVLNPLGMNRSSFVWREDYETAAAVGYRGQVQAEKSKPREALAAGTLHTTALDYAKFLATFVGTKPGVLTREWIDRMLTPQIEVGGSLAWGLGWGLERASDGPFFWQWGDDGEFKAFAMVSRRQERALVVLTNSASGLHLCREVVRATMGSDHPALSFPMLDYGLG